MVGNRVTVEALRLYVPLFQIGEAAEKKLEESPQEGAAKAVLLSQAGLKKLSYDEMVDLTYPLMRNEIQKAIRNSHLKRDENEIFSTIYYAGLDGMVRGLRKFDITKIDKSATNYLFQWIMVYAKKELLDLEAPMGIPPSRFQKHKKIAAVRKKLSEALGRNASNDEILEYFHTGKADFKNYNGPKIKTAAVSEANRKITLELIEEQEEIEKNLNFAQIYNSSDDYRSERLLATSDTKPFQETLMGAFIDSHGGFSTFAIAVLKSELQHTLSDDESLALAGVTTQNYRATMKIWKNYLSDPSGDFRNFVETSRYEDFGEVDMASMLRLIDSQGLSNSTIPRKYYVELFANKDKS